MSLRKLTKLVLVAFVLVLACGTPGSVQAYNPLAPDLVLYDGGGRTIGVYVLNLTPYTMTFDSGLVNTNMNGTPMYLRNLTQQVRNAGETGPFVPTGVPTSIPAALPGVTLGPYPATVSFLDGYQYVNAYSLIWWINGVKATDVHGAQVTGNVKFTINFNRPKPPTNLQAGLFSLISDVVKEVVDIVKVIVDPANPVTWVKAFTGGYELTKEGKSFSQYNAQKSEGDTMYVSAYIPGADGYSQPGTQCPPGYNPDTDPNKENRNGTTWADDSVITQQPDMNGVLQSQFVVTTQILRGQKANSGQSNGTVPLMMVTVALYSDWATANTTTALNMKTSYGDAAATSQGARALKQVLAQRGKDGKRDMALLVRTMKRSDQETLLNAALALHGKHKYSAAEREKQEATLSSLADALKKHAKKM